MGFSVNTNLDALNTYRNLQNTQNSLSSSLAKLSSGLRINNAGDDAAGLTIATTLGSQVSGLQQASRNAQDGTSVVQTADGALSQAQSLLGRLRDLAVQAANDSNSTSARTAITHRGDEHHVGARPSRPVDQLQRQEPARRHRRLAELPGRRRRQRRRARSTVDLQRRRASTSRGRSALGSTSHGSTGGELRRATSRPWHSLHDAATTRSHGDRVGVHGADDARRTSVDAAERRTRTSRPTFSGRSCATRSNQPVIVGREAGRPCSATRRARRHAA